MDNTKEELKKTKKLLRKAKIKKFFVDNEDVLIMAGIAGVACAVVAGVGCALGQYVGRIEGFQLGEHYVPIKALIDNNIITEQDIKNGDVTSYIMESAPWDPDMECLEALKDTMEHNGADLTKMVCIAVSPAAH